MRPDAGDKKTGYHLIQLCSNGDEYDDLGLTLRTKEDVKRYEEVHDDGYYGYDGKEFVTDYRFKKLREQGRIL